MHFRKEHHCVSNTVLAIFVNVIVFKPWRWGDSLDFIEEKKDSRTRTFRSFNFWTQFPHL